MNLLDLNSILRIIQLIPLILMLIPLVNSYLIKRNKINGLRRVRVALIILISAMVFSNIYFFLFSYFKISRVLLISQFVVFIEKIFNILAYWLLLYLFSHARQHKK